MRQVAIVSVLTVAVLAGCAPTPSVSAPVSPGPTATVEAGAPTSAAVLEPTGTPTVVASGLAAPWSMLRLPSGSTLISERDTGTIDELTAAGTLRTVGVVPDVVHIAEGGLLGLEAADGWLYAYLSTASDNRIVRFQLLGGPGSYAIGAGQPILIGLATAKYHNGGRIKFGPDGMLYATVGDATDPSNAQNLDSLNGKILRMTPDGAVPADNPFANSLVYSYGHRNPQGLAWDDSGQLWAAEFGQDTWDELNQIRAGGDYGWPIVEGASGDPAYIDPAYQWATDDASPSGLAYAGGSFFLAALKGQRLWIVHPGSPAIPFFVGEFGRIRDVVPGPDGTLWMLTNNTDGRGQPTEGDDRILQVQLAPTG